MSKSEHWNNGENKGNLRKSKNKKCGFLRMLLGRRKQNIRMFAQLEMPKNRGELYNDVNISKSKNWKNDENREIFSKYEKPNIWVPRDFIKKAHAKFQEASSNGNREELYNDGLISKSKNRKKRRKCRKFFENQ